MDFLNSKNIFLFVPNLIGYARIILTLISFYFMPTKYIISFSCYMLGVILDAFDGYAARALNQSTKFGAMLDQLVDRCGLMGLLFSLAVFYPKYIFFWILSAVIDISCHWIYLHSSILQKKDSHKAVDLSSNPIMHMYYSNKLVLGFMCGANESFYALLYLIHFTCGPIFGPGFSILKIACCLCFPFAVIKTIISLVHGYVACVNMALIDQVERKQSVKQQ